MIHADIELVGAVAVDPRIHEIIILRGGKSIRVRTDIQHLLANRVDHAGGNPPAVAAAIITPGDCGNHEILPGIGGAIRIPDGCCEHALPPDGLRHGAEPYDGSSVPQAFVVAENERLVLDDRSAERAAELI